MKTITTLCASLLISVAALRAQDEPDRVPGMATGQMAEVDSAVKPVPIIPTPQETYWGKGQMSLGESGACECTVELTGAAQRLSLIPGEFAKRLARRFGVGPEAKSGAPRFVFALDPGALPGGAELAAKLRTIGKEGYVLKTVDAPDGAEVLIVGNSDQALWHGMVTAAGLVSRADGRLVFPRIEIVDYPRVDDRSLLVEIGGQGFMVGPSRWDFNQWKEFVDWMVDHKFNDVWLEFIGSGRLMGNLNMDAGQWVGFPLTLQSYPQLVGRDRPIQRWDAAQQKVVNDTYTIPNVTHEFVRELIDYAQARGVRCDLAIGWDYFANQMPSVLHLPANDPENPAANKVYDATLKEIVGRYSNASGVVLVTIENKGVPPTMLNSIIRRANEAYRMIRTINPKMEVALLPDYLEWRPLHEIELLKQGVPSDMVLAYSPHREPQQKSWERIYGNMWRFQLYSQYAWDHIAYIFPEQIQKETLLAYVDGYRRIVSQGWYFDVFAVNYLAMAEYTWNPTSGPVDAFWNKALDEEFGQPARNLMRTALEHTRFDLRFDIIARMILRPNIESPFSFWDMYKLTQIPALTDSMLAALEDDARQSLAAAQAALPLVFPEARERVEVTVISAERRLYLATSARHLLKALAAKKSGQIAAARTQMDSCLNEAAKMEAAAERLGIEFPMAVHDDKVVKRYQEIRAGLN